MMVLDFPPANNPYFQGIYLLKPGLRLQKPTITSQKRFYSFYVLFYPLIFCFLPICKVLLLPCFDHSESGYITIPLLSTESIENMNRRQELRYV